MALLYRNKKTPGKASASSTHVSYNPEPTKASETKKPGRRVRRIRPSRRRAGWDSAKPSNHMTGFSTMPVNINQEIMADLRPLVARARQIEKNNPYAKRFMQLAKSNIVGPKGMRLKSKARKANGKKSPLITKAIESAWQKWCALPMPGGDTTCCKMGRLTMTDMQNLAVHNFFREGEILIVRHMGSDEGEHGISIKFMDPLLLDPGMIDEHEGNRVEMGIEYDVNDRAVAYHVQSQDSNHNWYYSRGGNDRVRVPAENVIHAFMSEYPEQRRGFSQIASAMDRLYALDGYEEAEVVGARVGSSTMGFIIPNAEGGGYDGDGSVIPNDPDEDEDYEIEEPEIVADPGTFEYLNPGAKVETFNPNHPNSAYQAFVKTCLRGVAAGFGISYTDMSGDREAVNFSSMRIGTIEDREIWKGLQNFLIDHVFSIVYRWWLEAALLSGAVTLEASGESLKAAATKQYTPHVFLGRRWGWLDPLKDIQTAEKALGLGITSLTRLMIDRGDDPEEVRDELEADIADLKKRGLPVPAVLLELQKDLNTEDPKEPEEEVEEDVDDEEEEQDDEEENEEDNEPEEDSDDV